MIDNNYDPEMIGMFVSKTKLIVNVYQKYKN